MSQLKMFHFSCIALFSIALAFTPIQSQAATKSNHKTAESTKEPLVLMPLRVPEEDKNLTGAMETALVKGLQQKYDVFSGEQVSQKAHEIFMKESRNTAHKECDETKCMQNIAMAFQAELIATANVTRQDGIYYLALSIQNIFDNKVVYSESMPCKNCDGAQVIEQLKELSGSSDNTKAAEAALAAERKAKAEELKQEQLAFEEKLRNADAAERKRLLDAKAEDDKHIAALKAQAEARRKSSSSQVPSDFPTIESAIAEIDRLKNSIHEIKAGYDKELAQTRQKVNDRYTSQLAAVDKTQRDEFETTEEFNAKLNKKRNELNQQRDEELGRMNTATLSASDIAPLQEKIKELSNREYTLSAEALVVNLGSYNADERLFPVSINSKISGIRVAEKGVVPLPIAEAKIFKQQWVAGLVRGEAKMKPSGEYQVAIVNDADNSRLNNYAGRFLTEARAPAPALALTGILVPIPGKNYELGKYDVTQAQWQAVMGTNPSHFKNCGDNCPVESVSWNDVQEFLEKLNSKTGRQYRLPTEAEWEYACHGGNQSEYCGGNDPDRVAWYNENSNMSTHLVGQKLANGYGLYDMSGNVWQWMENKYDNELYNHDRHALRGGSWSSNAFNLRAAYRNSYFASSREGDASFRLARTLP